MAFRSCSRRCRRIHPGSVSNLCSATLGAGALSLPFAIRLTGIVLGVLLLIFSAYFTVVSIDVIIEACTRTQLFKYEDVALRLAGKRAGRALEASLLIFCFGTAVAYIVAVGDILDQGLRSIPFLWEKDSDGKAYVWGLISMYSRERIMILFWALVMFPLSLQRQVEALERFSPLGVLSIIFLVLSAVIHSISHGVVIGNGGDSQQIHQTDISFMLWPDSFWSVVQAIPIIIFAFSCQVNVCEIFEELTPIGATIDDVVPTLKSKQLVMEHITRKGITLCTTLYICIGLFGFLDFSHATQDNILNNYCVQTTHDPLMITASAFVVVAVVVAFPFNILPARVTLKLILERLRKRRRSPREDNIASIETSDGPVSSSPRAMTADGSHPDVTDPLLGDDRFGDRPSMIPHMSLEGLPPQEEGEVYSTESPPLEHFLLTLLLCGSALIVALLIPGISVVFGLMGGTAASIISFILPGMFLMETSRASEENGRPSKGDKVLALFFVLGGTLIGVLSTGVTIYGLFNPGDDASVDSCGN